VEKILASNPPLKRKDPDAFCLALGFLYPIFSYPLTLLFTVAGFLIVEHRFSLTAF
jgi:hypothetical protein